MPLFSRPAASPTLQYFDNMGANELNMATSEGILAIPYNTLLIQPIAPFNELFPGKMTVNTCMLNISVASQTFSSTNASTAAFSSSFMLGVYTRGSGASTSIISLINSFNSSLTRAANSSNSSIWGNVGGPRWLTIHSSVWSTLPNVSEERYWFGVLAKSSGVNIAASWVGQFMLHSVQRMGTFGTSSSHTSMKHFPFMGILSASTTALPTTIAESMISAVNASANFIPHVVFNNRESVL